MDLMDLPDGALPTERAETTPTWPVAEANSVSDTETIVPGWLNEPYPWELSEPASSKSSSLEESSTTTVPWVCKRDGQVVPFDTGKLTNSIYVALYEPDRPHPALQARLLADAVLFFLARDFDDCVPTTADVRQMVGTALREFREPVAAARYETWAEQKQQLGQASLYSFPAVTANVAASNLSGSPVAGLTWQKSRLAAQLRHYFRLPTEVATEVVRRVERRLVRAECSQLSATLLQELIRLELSQLGWGRAAQQLVAYTLQRTVLQQAVVGLLPAPTSLAHWLGGQVLRQYGLHEVFSPDLVALEREGIITIEMPQAVDRWIGQILDLATDLAGVLATHTTEAIVGTPGTAGTAGTATTVGPFGLLSWWQDFLSQWTTATVTTAHALSLPALDALLAMLQPLSTSSADSANTNSNLNPSVRTDRSAAPHTASISRETILRPLWKWLQHHRDCSPVTVWLHIHGTIPSWFAETANERPLFAVPLQSHHNQAARLYAEAIVQHWVHWQRNDPTVAIDSSETALSLGWPPKRRPPAELVLHYPAAPFASLDTENRRHTGVTDSDPNKTATAQTTVVDWWFELVQRCRVPGGRLLVCLDRVPVPLAEHLFWQRGGPLRLLQTVRLHLDRLPLAGRAQSRHLALWRSLSESLVRLGLQKLQFLRQLQPRWFKPRDSQRAIMVINPTVAWDSLKVSSNWDLYESACQRLQTGLQRESKAHGLQFLLDAPTVGGQEPWPTDTMPIFGTGFEHFLDPGLRPQTNDLAKQTDPQSGTLDPLPSKANNADTMHYSSESKLAGSTGVSQRLFAPAEFQYWLNEYGTRPLLQYLTPILKLPATATFDSRQLAPLLQQIQTQTSIRRLFLYFTADENE